MIAIIDYGVGNLRSVQKALQKVGCRAEVTRDEATIESAAGVVLPGVGAFSAAADRLRESGLTGAVLQAIEEGRPFLGICVGMQLLFEESEEDGVHRGLGVIPGRVRRLPPGLKVPHMGWNNISFSRENPFLEGIPSMSRFYFVHSYYPDPTDEEVVATETEYGVRFTSSVVRGNLFACQFHPEKSGDLGLKVLANFARIAGMN